MERSSTFQPVDKNLKILKNGRKKFLANPLGQQLDYVVNLKENVVTVHTGELNAPIHVYTFPKEMECIDVDYFPAADSTFGLIVAINDESEIWGAKHFVVGLSPIVKDNVPSVEMIPTWSLAVYEKITVIKTLFTNADMASEDNNFKLFSKLNQWKNIIAIGARKANCYICELLPQQIENEDDIIVNKSRKNVVNILDIYKPKGKDVFIYAIDDLSKQYIASTIHVTSLALLPRSRTLLVGLSCGGIITAGLNPSNTMHQLELRHQRAVRHLVPLEPEDDPEKFEYFIVAIDGSPRHPIIINLWRGTSKEKENSDDEQTTFYLAFEHRILYGSEWICAKTLTHSRFLDNGLATYRTRRTTDGSMNESSIMNTSQSFGSAWNRSLVLLAYKKLDEKGKSIVEAGIFDIDSYYYKRLPQSVTSDKTCLSQCAFLTFIKSNISSEDIEDISILIENENDISRFTSAVSDADQLFYPSSFNFPHVFIGTSSTIEQWKIASLQNNLLDHVAENLIDIMKEPGETAMYLMASGIVPTSVALSSSPNSSMNESLLAPRSCELSAEERVVLNAMLYNTHAAKLTGLASTKEISNEKKEEVATWIFYESCDFKRTIVDRTSALFDGRSIGATPNTDSLLLKGIHLFSIVIPVIREIAKNYNEKSKLKTFLHASKCTLDHLKLVHQFIYYGIIPLDQRTGRKMREMHERRVAAATKNRVALPIQLTVRQLNIKMPDREFWDGVEQDQWYPPTPSNILEPILNVNVSERVKRELVIQYVVDWIRASSSEKKSDSEIAKEAQKNISDNMLGTNMERILFILEQERRATKEDESKKLRVFGNKVESTEASSSSSPPPHLPKSQYDEAWRLYEQLTSADKNKFEKRYQLEKENGGIGLPELQGREEQLYQLYLYNHEKFSHLSKDFIDSTKVTKAILPHVASPKKKNTLELTEKEKDIRVAIGQMFARSKEKRSGADGSYGNLSVFSRLGSKVDDSNVGRKRKSINMTDMDDDEENPVPFMPPTAKRITRPKPMSPHLESTSSPVAPNVQNEENDAINRAIRTPAKYLKRSTNIEEEQVSPVNRVQQVMTCPNSILKTAKTVQSPSRGRIRFHDNLVEESTPKLNFNILDEADEDVNRTLEDDQPQEKESEMFEDCVEEEKSFERQDEVKVVQIGNNEMSETYEECTLEMVTPEREQVSLKNSETIEVEEKEAEETEAVEEAEEEMKDDEEEQIKEKEKEGEEEESIEFEKSQEIAEEVEENKEEEEEKEEKEEQMETMEDQKVSEEFKEPSTEMEEIKDLVERSFELQKDEDILPIESTEEAMEEDSPAVEQDIIVGEERQESKSPSPLPSDTPNIEQTNIGQSTIETVKEKMEMEKEEEQMEVEEEVAVKVDVVAPAVRATRSRTTSRSEKTPSPSDFFDEKELQNTSLGKRIRETPKRGISVNVPSVESSARRSARIRTRSESVQPIEETKKEPEQKTPRKKTTSVVRTTKTIKEETEEKKEKTPVKGKRSASRARMASVEVEDKTLEPTTPKRGRPRSVSRNPVSTLTTPEKVETAKGSATRRAGSVTRSSQPKTVETPSNVEKTPRSSRRPRGLSTIDEVKEQPTTSKTTREKRASSAQPTKTTKSSFKDAIAKKLEENGQKHAAETVRKVKPRAASVASKVTTIEEEDEEAAQQVPATRRSARRPTRQ